MKPLSLLVVTAAMLLITNAAAYAQPDDLPKFEVGGQFTFLADTRPEPIFDCCVATSPGDFDPVKKYGVGGRFAFNLTDNISLEAEANFFPKQERPLFDLFHAVPTGNVIQGQMGIKAGKRFKRFGLFGKARPGFVNFSEVSQLVSTRTITFLGQQFIVGDFRVTKQTYFSMDIGGVVEFYPSRRTLVRIDVGDTFIRYGTFRIPGSSLSGAILERPPETKHSLQFGMGFGYRF